MYVCGYHTALEPCPYIHTYAHRLHTARPAFLLMRLSSPNHPLGPYLTSRILPGGPSAAVTVHSPRAPRLGHPRRDPARRTGTAQRSIHGRPQNPTRRRTWGFSCATVVTASAAAAAGSLLLLLFLSELGGAGLHVSALSLTSPLSPGRLSEAEEDACLGASWEARGQACAGFAGKIPLL